MWVRGLKLRYGTGQNGIYLSHPMWVRGLKLDYQDGPACDVESHPMWVRGLKHVFHHYIAEAVCRTPCGCVD